MYANAPPFHPTSHRHSTSHGGAPPPAKKVKGNPIITKYPPPPGYRPPIQSAQLNTFGQVPSWQGGQNYGQPAYLGYQQHAHVKTPAPGYSPHLAAQPDIAQHVSYSTAQTQWAPSAPLINHGRHEPVPPISTAILDGNGEPLPPLHSSDISGATLEHDLDEECCYARHPELIEPSLSLGTVVWKAPIPAETPLPPTFREAQLEAIAPLAPARANGQIVATIRSEEALLSIRQTGEWYELKDSLIFKEFPKVCEKLISFSELLAEYRSRFDAQWAAGSRSPTPSLTREPTPPRSDSRTSNYSQHAGLDQQGGAIHPTTEQVAAFGGQLDVLDDLEVALRSGSRPASVSHSRVGSAVHSRAGSVAHSRAGSVLSNLTRPKALPVVRDAAQEDVLAALGVRGSPQMVYETPGPAFGPAPAMANGSRNRHSRESSVASSRSSLHPQQPAIPEEPDAVDAVIGRLTRGQTVASLQPIECDVEPDDNATPKPQRWQRDNMRKRSYADSQAGAYQADDDTPKRPRPSCPDYTAR